MAKMIIKLAPNDVMRDMILHRKDPAEFVSTNLERYTACPAIETEWVGEDAAEEAFDLTNNPSRQDEREAKYGRGRSVSVGDVIEVDGVNYACASFGWVKL